MLTQSADRSKQFYWGLVHLYFNTPVVVLDHSDHVKSVEYSADHEHLTILFDSQEGYDHAVSTWTKDLHFVTNTPGCGGFHGDERCYFTVNNLDYEPQSRTIIAAGTSKPADECTTGGETEWGLYKPGKSANIATHSFQTSFQKRESPEHQDLAPEKGFSCNLPKSNKYKLPMACEGPEFDEDLDDQLGFGGRGFADNKILNELVEGFVNPGKGMLPMDFNFRKFIRGTTIEKRASLDIWDGLKKFAKGIGNALEKAYNTAKDFVVKVINTPITPEIHKGFQIRIPDGTKFKNTTKVKQVASPWSKDSLLLASFKSNDSKSENSKSQLKYHINLFCVECGAKGQVELGGRASWTVAKGFSAGEVSVGMDMKVGLKLGLDAQITYKWSDSFEILEISTKELTYGAIGIGPMITLGVFSSAEGLNQALTQL
jgi:hypothetical protein